jgi:alkanesulfonate monooxygenase SsuD/methylene tetrahydromethanopterin reductase-like flavin-dependent oxidoreductase (luciferase family)
MLEGYSTLGYLAAITQNVKLGTRLPRHLSHPGVLIKMVTTLDVLSAGELTWVSAPPGNERETVGWVSLSRPLVERSKRLEETLQIALQMWSDNNGPFIGKHYRLAETLNNPQPLSKPHPPILIGGVGERKTLRLVARYADSCNFFARLGTNTLRQKLEVLKNHCDAPNAIITKSRKPPWAPYTWRPVK